MSFVTFVLSVAAIQYQRRATDEAADTVLLCAACPLDMERATIAVRASESTTTDAPVPECGEYVGPGKLSAGSDYFSGLAACNLWYGKCEIDDPEALPPKDEYEISHGRTGPELNVIFDEISRRGSVRRVLYVMRVVVVPFRGALVQGISRVRLDPDQDSHCAWCNIQALPGVEWDFNTCE